MDQKDPVEVATPQKTKTKRIVEMIESDPTIQEPNEQNTCEHRFHHAGEKFVQSSDGSKFIDHKFVCEDCGLVKTHRETMKKRRVIIPQMPAVEARPNTSISKGGILSKTVTRVI